jgi:hypothetical protein
MRVKNQESWQRIFELTSTDGLLNEAALYLKATVIDHEVWYSL